MSYVCKPQALTKGALITHCEKSVSELKGETGVCWHSALMVLSQSMTVEENTLFPSARRDASSKAATFSEREETISASCLADP